MASTAPSSHNSHGSTPSHTLSHPPSSLPSDSEWEECVVLKDGKRYPVAEHEKHITTFALFAIIYLCVTGGPYGLEDGVRAATGGNGGVGWVMLLMLLLPMLVHFPVALLTSELASSMPQNGGYILWVSRAFGNFWGFQEGWYSWCSSLVDTALYPFLVIAYLQSLIQQCGLMPLSSLMLFLAHTLLSIIIALLNLTNSQLVGTPSLVLSIVFLIPFFLISALGLKSILPSTTISFEQLFTFPAWSRLNWGLTLSSILWVGAGWDSVGTVGNDVKRPKTTYPRAITLAMIAVTLTNFLPILVAVVIDTHYREYDAMKGFWVKIANMVGGKWLGWFITVTSILGNLHLFNVLFTSSSWSLFALCLPGLLDVPRFLQLHNHYQTPVWCIVTSTIGVILCGFYTFDGLLQLAMAFNALALMLQCFSLIHLRISEPLMKRPYRIMLRTPFVALFFACPILISILLLLTIETLSQIIVIIGVMVGVVSYYVARWAELERHNEERAANPAAATDLEADGRGKSRGSLSGLMISSNADDDVAYRLDRQAEYDGSALAPQQPQPINLQAMFEEMSDDQALVTGYRTSALAESLPDFISPNSMAATSTTNSRSLFSPAALTVAEGEEVDVDDDDEDDDHEGGAASSGSRAGGEGGGRRPSFTPLRINRPVAVSADQDVDDDDRSPLRVPSPVLLRSPKEGRRSLNTSPATTSTTRDRPASTTSSTPINTGASAPYGSLDESKR